MDLFDSKNELSVINLVDRAQVWYSLVIFRFYIKVCN